MATSSIFHTVVLDTQEKLDAFLNALEESEKDPYVGSERVVYQVVNPNGKGVHFIHEFPDKPRKAAIK